MTARSAITLGILALGAWSGCALGVGDAAPATTGVPVAPPRARARTRVPPPLALAFVSDEPTTSPLPRDLPSGTTETSPALVDDDDEPERVRVVSISYGDASVGGITPSVYEIHLVSAATARARKVYRGEVSGEGAANVQLVDLDRDGRMEMLIAESGSYMDCDMGGGALTLRWLVIDAYGRTLYRSDPHALSYTVGGPSHDLREHATIRTLPSGAAVIELRDYARRRVLAAAPRSAAH